MTAQDLLRALKTSKKASYPSNITSVSNSESIDSIFNVLYSHTSHIHAATTIIDTPSDSAASDESQTVSSILSKFSPNKLQRVLWDPSIETSHCLEIFKYLLQNQSELSFKPSLHAHLTIICRLIKSRKFDGAQQILRNVIIDQDCRYPFSSLCQWVEKYCKESKIMIRLLNSVLKVYSDHQMFDRVSMVFDYMRNNGYEIDERTCTLHLNALTRFDQVNLALEFFRWMVDSGMRVSVFSLTVVINGLCKSGQIKNARQLVEEMCGRGIKPNIITCSILVNSCTKMWNFDELDLVLHIMRKEGIEFDDSTYKYLIDGYVSCRKIQEAEKFVLEMHDKGFGMNAYLYTTVIRGYCAVGSMNSGIALLRKMQERGLTPHADTYSSLIDGYCRVGDMVAAKDWVDEMLNKGGVLDEVMLKTLVDGYRMMGMMGELSELQHLMKKKGSCPDEVTLGMSDD